MSDIGTGRWAGSWSEQQTHGRPGLAVRRSGAHKVKVTLENFVETFLSRVALNSVFGQHSSSLTALQIPKEIHHGQNRDVIC
jgi:hypothetical protein